MKEQLGYKRLRECDTGGIDPKSAHKAARKETNTDFEEILTKKDLPTLFKGDTMSTYDLAVRVEELVPSAQRRFSPLWSRVQIRFLTDDDVPMMKEWAKTNVSATASSAYGIPKEKLQDPITWKPSTRRGWIWWAVQLDGCVVGAVCLSGVVKVGEDGVPHGYNAKGGNSKPKYNNFADFNWLKSDLSEGVQSEQQRTEAKGVMKGVMTYAMQCVIDWTMYAEPKLNGILVVVRTEPIQTMREKKETYEKRLEYSNRSIKLATIGLNLEESGLFEQKYESEYKNATMCLMTRGTYEKVKETYYVYHV